MNYEEFEDYDAYEAMCDKTRKENEKYLEIFKDDLIAQDLVEKTIKKHLSNVEFYINVFLLHYGVIPMKDGVYEVDEFLGYYFIKKCLWSTPATIKENISSLKKFYKCMLEHELVSQESYDFLCTIIKENKEVWLEDCKQFNDPSQDSPFAFF